MAGLEGKTLGNCHILRRIGGGGMGEVYLAEQRELGRQVAVKVILGAGSLEAGARAQASQQFLQEARAVAALDHPHILPLYAYGQEDDIHYLVMPYIPDGSLANLVQGPPGPSGVQFPLPMVPALVVEIVTQAAAALQFAHDRGVIHRDVKPQNMLVRLLSQAHSVAAQTVPSPMQPSVTGGPAMAPLAPGASSSSLHVLLADFGLARYLADLAGTTGATGTPLYSSPEQCRGYPVPATDQYALACVAYYLLSGKPVFEGTVAELHHQHLAVVPRSILQVNPMLPPATDTVLQRALAKDPEQRYRRIYEFAQSLQNALVTAQMTGVPMQPQQPQQLQRPWPAPNVPVNPQSYVPQPSVPLYAPNAAQPTGAPVYSQAVPPQPGMPAAPFPGAPMPPAMPQPGMLAYPSSGQPNPPNLPQGMHPTAGAPVPPYAPGPIAGSPLPPPMPASPAGLTVATQPAYAPPGAAPSPGASPGASPASPYSSAPPPAVVPTGGWRAQADGPAAPLPPRSRRGPLFELGGREVSRRTFVIGAAAVVGVAAVGAGIVVLSKGGASTAHPPRATPGPASATAKLRWTYPAGGKVLGTAAVANGTVYFGALDRYVYALNALTGALTWRAATGGQITGSPAIAGGIVYIGSNDGNLYALDATSGKLRWKFNAQSQLGTTPVVSGGTVYLGWGQYVAALNAATGKLRWRYLDKQGDVNSPSVGNGQVYYGGNGHVIALSANTGRFVWQYPHGNGAVFSNALADGDAVYIGDHAGSVNALSARDGTLRWQGKTHARVLDQPTAASGAVYVGSEDGSIYAFDVSTGKTLWSYATAKPSYSSPAIVNGVVYGASTDSYVYALDATTGKLLWRFSCQAGIEASPVVSRGVLYIGASDDNLYALNT